MTFQDHVCPLFMSSQDCLTQWDFGYYLDIWTMSGTLCQLKLRARQPTQCSWHCSDTQVIPQKTHRVKQSWKDTENGHKGSWKVLANAHKKVLESHGNHFQCSVCTLQSSWSCIFLTALPVLRAFHSVMLSVCRSGLCRTPNVFISDSLHVLLSHVEHSPTSVSWILVFCWVSQVHRCACMIMEHYQYIR